MIMQNEECYKEINGVLCYVQPTGLVIYESGTAGTAKFPGDGSVADGSGKTVQDVTGGLVAGVTGVEGIKVPPIPAEARKCSDAAVALWKAAEVDVADLDRKNAVSLWAHAAQLARVARARKLGVKYGKSRLTSAAAASVAPKGVKFA